jgi:hypothetical protein
MFKHGICALDAVRCDLGMLFGADEATIVDSDELTRSKTMEHTLLDAIHNNSLRAQQAMFSKNAPARLDPAAHGTHLCRLSRIHSLSTQPRTNAQTVSHHRQKRSEITHDTNAVFKNSKTTSKRCPSRLWTVSANRISGRTSSWDGVCACRSSVVER